MSITRLHKNVLCRRIYSPSAGEVVFMQVVENGKLILYEDDIQNYNGMAATTSVRWYISKGPGPISELKSNDFTAFASTRKERKDFFSEMLSDNKQAYDMFILDKKFDFHEIRKIVHLYNTGELLKDPEKPSYNEL